jgi:hypothetical protein
MQMKQGYNGSECYQERILLNKKNLHLVSRHQKIMSHYLSGGINMATRSFDRFLCTEGKWSCIKNVAKYSLPLIGSSQRKASITRQICRDWFVNYFVPEMTKYLDENNIAFKVLFVLDNASAHDLDHVSICPNINVVFVISYHLSYTTSGPQYQQYFEYLLLKLTYPKID